MKQFRLVLAQMLDNGTNARPVARGSIEAAADRDLPRVTGLNVMPAAAMVVVGMCHAADDTELVARRGKLRQGFANEQARRLAGRGLEWPADLRRRLRLQIERLKLARSAEQ